MIHYFLKNYVIPGITLTNAVSYIRNSIIKKVNSDKCVKIQMAVRRQNKQLATSRTTFKRPWRCYNTKCCVTGTCFSDIRVLVQSRRNAECFAYFMKVPLYNLLFILTAVFRAHEGRHTVNDYRISFTTRSLNTLSGG